MNYFNYILECNNKQICFICNSKLIQSSSVYTWYKCNNCTDSFLAITEQNSYNSFTIDEIHFKCDSLHEELNIYDCKSVADRRKLLVYRFALNHDCSKRYISFNYLTYNEAIDNFIIESFEDIKSLCHNILKVQILS
jgi:hypothetical protein